VWNVTVDALQKSLALENRPNEFAKITVRCMQIPSRLQILGWPQTQLEKLAEGTLRFDMPIYPQKAQLDIFVQRVGNRASSSAEREGSKRPQSINSLPHFFNSYPDDIDLIHHLQRYAACYVAYKTGYFYHTAVGENTVS
jgi:hypothetical protein